MTTNHWITDRPPTATDGDGDGDVLVRYHPSDDEYTYMHWSYVGEVTPWKHCEEWQPATASQPTPRKFASISRTIAAVNHTIDAIDDDGVAWYMVIGPHDSKSEWHQLTPLPNKEVVG